MSLSANRIPPRQEVWYQRTFPLANSVTAYAGGLCALDTATAGLVTPAANSTTQILIGVFAEKLVGDGTSKVNVELLRPVKVVWLNNTDSGHTAATTDIGNICYLKDDLGITMDSTTASKAGRIWDIATIDGIAMAAVELFCPAVGDS